MDTAELPSFSPGVHAGMPPNVFVGRATMSRFITRIWIVSLVVPLLVGCGRFGSSPPPVIKITIEQPGAHPQDVEIEICNRVWLHILRGKQLSAITCVSSEGLGEIYVEGEANIDATSFLNQINSLSQQAVPELPADAKLITVTKVSRKDIPTELDIHDVDRQNIHVDRDKAARLGVSISAIINAVKSAVETGKPLTEVTVETNNGTKVRLDDVVGIEKVREPNCRIMRWPPKEESQ